MAESNAGRTARAAAVVAVFVINGLGAPVSAFAGGADKQFSPGHYDVSVTYDTIGAADVTIGVNSQPVRVESVPSAGEWSITTRVHLDQGVTEITVGASTGLWLSDVTATPVTQA